jgi:hypothetical protein
MPDPSDEIHLCACAPVGGRQLVLVLMHRLVHRLILRRKCPRASRLSRHPRRRGGLRTRAVPRDADITDGWDIATLREALVWR